MNANKELIFVYNANSGKWNAYMDSLHKLISPSTYPCSLCAITHDTFAKKKAWANFLTNTTLQLHFLHKDEWNKIYHRKDNLPAIFVKQGEDISTFLEADEINRLNLVDLQAKLKAYEQE